MQFNKIKKQDAWEEVGNFEKVLQANHLPSNIASAANFLELKWLS
jgi:hypothetical protein